MKKLKRIVSVAIVMLCMHTTYSQARLGYSLAEISEEFGTDETYLSGFPNESWVSVGSATALIYYAFNDRKECEATFISPYTDEDFQYYLNKYNRDYKKTSAVSWVIIEPEFNIYITMQTTKEGIDFFHWSY